MKNLNFNLDFVKQVVDLKTKAGSEPDQEDQTEMDFSVEIEHPRRVVEHLVNNLISSLFVDKNRIAKGNCGSVRYPGGIGSRLHR